jgi:hypothetical protein
MADRQQRQAAPKAESGERLPVDIFGQDRLEGGLAGLMRSNSSFCRFFDDCGLLS